MNNTIIVGLLCVCAMPALADPPTPNSPPSGNGFQSVGNGLFLAVNNGGFTLQHGKNLTVAVFSREGSEINVGDHYSIDVSSINGLTVSYSTAVSSENFICNLWKSIACTAPTALWIPADRLTI